MKRKLRIVYISFMLGLATVVGFSSCEGLSDILGNATGSLSAEEIVKGLKTALDTSSRQSVNTASVVDGFYKNLLIQIPLPEEILDLQEFANDYNPSGVAQMAVKGLLTTFASQQFQDLHKSINRAAEQGSKEAYSIFKDAILSMTITDGLKILQDGDTAATSYLRQKTYNGLIDAFKPIVQTVVKEGTVSSLWGDVAQKYNLAAPAARGFGYHGPQHVNPDLSEYITEHALKGLFKLVGREEAKIRKDPLAYASDIIQKVFGSPEAKRNN